MLSNHYRNIIVIFAAILIACSASTKSRESEQHIIINIINENQQSPGIYNAFWPQTNANGEKVSDGKYIAHLITDSVIDENGLSISFDVSGTALHVPLPVGSVNDDTTTQSLPTNFSISVNSATYALGDTIMIIYKLPISDSNIKINISE